MTGQTTGIDRRGDKLYSACVERGSGRPKIIGLTAHEILLPESTAIANQSEIVLAIPDSAAIVKQLVLPAGDPATLNDRLEFELTHCLLEPEENFRLRFHPVDDNGHYLGFVFRREFLNALPGEWGLAPNPAERPPAFSHRALALGLGYLTFCQREQGDLICLADLSESDASICLILNQRVVDLTSLSISGRDLSSSDARLQLAVDLKTVVNFRLSQLLDRGTSLPLTALVLSGEQVDEAFRQSVQNHFSMGVRPPRLPPGFLDDSITDNPASPDLFLPALGLSVN